MKEKREGGKKIKAIQRGEEKKNQSKDNKSICEAGRNKLHYITGTKGSLSCPDKIFIHRVGNYFFNCLRRFKYTARYLQLYKDFLLAMQHCSSSS